MSVEHLLIGADPELFVYDKGFKAYRSAHSWMKGTKKEPFSTTFGAIQLDGVAAEFNIIPTNNVTDFIRRINQGVGCITGLAKKHNSNYEVRASPVAYFTKDYWATLPETVLELGCDPDFDAWKVEVNQRPHTTECFRTGAGHIHLGWYPKVHYQDDVMNEQHIFDCVYVTKNLDFVLFLLSQAWDTDRKRRTLYGGRGTFRPKPYGVEYRVLSNAWLNHTLLMGWVYNVAMHTLRMMDEDVRIYEDTELNRYMYIVDKGTLTWPQLAVVHNLLVDKYKFPPLPKFIWNPELRSKE